MQKILAGAGFASRRGAEELIRQGRVTINGETAGLGDLADPGRDRVEFDGERIRAEKLVYWLVNKPEGVVSTVRDPEGRPTVLGLLPRNVGRIYPVGRLDRETSGLLLLTNDGALTQQLLHPSLGNEREYRVMVRGEVERKTFDRLAKGVYLDEGRTAPARIGRNRYDADANLTSFTLTISEGRKRQIRRSLLVLKHPVKKLVRVRMGPLRLGKLRRGEARPLREDELRTLRSHAASLVSRRAAPRT
ncbi:MAG: rRNA pseudouridine synthase [Deltaproteobacteria bacterium]|nr:rRNA pseudouridine synthase [Deltaproteobacteria bacterium]MBW2418241.1 rRNA pseudouridine synthase [Deltaproteobacteria bacterium]